jgi:hypothetical protein
MFHEYEEVSKHYNSETSAWRRADVLIARVNAMHNQQVTNKYQIYAFPSIIFIPAHSQDMKSMFQGPRTKANFVDWIENQIKELKEHHFDERKKEQKESHGNYEVIHDIVEEAQGENGKEGDGDEHEEHEEEEQNEKYAKFEMVIEDVSSHASEKWRGEFNALSIKLDELTKAEQENTQELLIALSGLKQGFAEQSLQLLKKIESNSAKIDEVLANVVNRNNIENTQSRFNPTHMVIFVVLGVIIGFALSVYLVKIKPAKNFNKV